MAEIGGYVGLLLGASLVYLGHINNSVLDFFFGKKEQEMTRKQTINTIEPIQVQSARVEYGY